jgi:large subunit ribosomal protein L3
MAAPGAPVKVSGRESPRGKEARAEGAPPEGVGGMLVRKVGMMQIFTEQGTAVPVTVLDAAPNVVVRRKTQTRDGYDAAVLGAGPVPEKRLSKPAAGLFKKAKVATQRHLRELPVAPASELAVGSTVGVDVFAEGDLVDVTASSKGKGFAGVIKRHHFQRGPVSHGSMNIRQPGSIGASSDPSRVFKGMRMAGHLGNVQRTVRNLTVVRVDAQRHLLLLEGAVPGAPHGLVVVRRARKQPRKRGGKK